MGVLEGYALSFAIAWLLLLGVMFLGRRAERPGWRAMLGMAVPAALLGGLVFLGLGYFGLFEPESAADREDACGWMRRSLACDTGGTAGRR